MPVQFPGIAATNDGSEITARSGASFDKDYIDLGVDIISMRGYDLFADAAGIGRHVIPIVREEVAKRDRAAAGAGRATV
jgi:hypothetical protein